MSTARGKGLDRRHIITIDGRNYKRTASTAQVAARLEAKRIARETALCLLELLGMAMIVVSITLLAVGLAPDVAGVLGGLN